MRLPFRPSRSLEDAAESVRRRLRPRRGTLRPAPTAGSRKTPGQPGAPPRQGRWPVSPILLAQLREEFLGRLADRLATTDLGDAAADLRTPGLLRSLLFRLQRGDQEVGELGSLLVRETSELGFELLDSFGHGDAADGTSDVILPQQAADDTRLVGLLPLLQGGQLSAAAGPLYFTRS